MISEWRVSEASRRTFSRRDLFANLVMIGSGAVSVVAASGAEAKLVAGILSLCAEASLVLARRVLPRRWGGVGVLVGAAAGIAVVLVAPSGLGEVFVLGAVTVLPISIPPGPLRQAAVGVVSVAFGVTIWVVSGSPAGLLAGVGAWLLADRSIEHAALQVERDRAIALVAEVEASRQAQAEAAAAEERNRIAREMHDVLAHSLAGLSMQLQAIRAVAAQEHAPASLTGPLDRAAELAREGVQDARAAVGALRVPQLRGLDDLPALLDSFPGATHFAVTGEPGCVSATAGHAAYRAVQEAMTNAARYATGSTIDVAVAWSADEVVVRVRDHGIPAGRHSSGIQGSGTGLTSMTERVEAAGGTVVSGADPVGPGWRVELRLPAAEVAGRP